MPLVPVLPCLGIIGNCVLISAFDLQTWVYYGFYLIAGLLVYLGYGITHSQLEGKPYEGCSEVAEAEDIQMHDYNSFKDQKAPFMNN
jgi:hypothetical protein